MPQAAAFLLEEKEGWEVIKVLQLEKKKTLPAFKPLQACIECSSCMQI